MEPKRILIGKTYFKPKALKALIIFYRIVSIVLIAFGALLCIVSLAVGLPFVAIGVAFLLYAKKLNTKLHEALEAPDIKAAAAPPIVPKKQEVKQPAPIVQPAKPQQPKMQTKPESEKNYDLFDDYDADDNTYLAYSYEESLAFADTSILTGNGGKVIAFKQEPDNEYDKKAVAVYLNDAKVGYLYRGRTQDMVNDWIRRDMPFWGYVNKIDTANNKATIKIGFYRSLDELDMKKFRLTRITKKADEFGSSRYDNVGCCSDGDLVEYTTSFDSDNYVITDECGEELGEVGAKAVEFIDEHEDSIKFMRINNIEDTDSGGYKADIEIFYKA